MRNENTRKNENTERKTPQNQEIAIEVLPLRAGIQRERDTEVTVLVRLTAPPQQKSVGRAPLNVALVLDRSGSMAGAPLDAAKRAAQYAIQQLRAEDYIAVTVYDSEIETIVRSQKARDKDKMMERLARIESGGSTALHGGWVEGGMQVSTHQNPRRLNRVILLTDGHANCGETDPSRIAHDVKGLAQRGIGTTTMGVGDDYNEELLETMARAGDGSYYYIESARVLETIFQDEFQGLSAVFGHTVSLGVKCAEGVELIECLNNYDRNSYGRWMLPNLQHENSVETVLRLRVKAGAASSDRAFSLATFRVAFTSPASGERAVQRLAFSLPALPTEHWEALEENPLVREQVAHREMLKAREVALEALDRGDDMMAMRSFRSALSTFAASAPSAERLQEERDFTAEIEEKIASNEHAKARKSMHFDQYRGHRRQERRGS